MMLLVPGYQYPIPGSLWDTLIASPIGVGYAIVNDRSGALAGQSADPSYTALIAAARAANLPLMYYVDTGYATRTLGDIEADMDAWIALYGKPSGWFFDQASSLVADITLYESLRFYTDRQIVLNHGTTPDEFYLNDRVSDIAVIAETTAAGLASWTFPDWLTSYDRHRFAVLVHDATSSDLPAAWATITAQNVEYAFVTEATLYDSLPSYFSDELALTPPVTVSLDATELIWEVGDIGTEVVSDDDAGTATDAAALFADVADGHAGTFSDDAALFADVADGHAGTAVEDGALVASQSTAESATAAEVAGTDVATSSSDTGAAIDGVHLNVAFLDDAGLADAASTVIPLPLHFDALIVTDDTFTRIMRRNAFTRLEVR